MPSRRNISILSALIGAAWLITFTGISAFSNIANRQFEHIFSGRPLPLLTTWTVVFHQHFGFHTVILVFSTFAFGSYFLSWLFRQPTDSAGGASCVLALNFTAVLFYIFTSITALLLPFVAIISRLEANTTNVPSSNIGPIFWMVLTVVYVTGLVLIARRLKW